MAFNFDDLKKKASDLAARATVMGKAGAARSRQLASAAKLKANNLAEEDTIRKAYAEIGKVYFEKYGQNPEDDFAAACTTIIEAQAAIAANNALIEELMAKDEPDIEVEIVEEAPVEEAVEEVKAAVVEAVEEVKEAVEEVVEEAAPVVEEVKEAVEEVVEEVVEAVTEEEKPEE